MSQAPEAWLRGPIESVDPYLMPVAHALVQAGEDLERAAADLTPEELWARPGGAASIGFHLRHIAGVVDRLLTYANGEMLSEAQLRALRTEGEPGEPPAGAAELVRNAREALARALDQVRRTPRDALLEPRAVGRARLPSTVLGLLYHAGEHATRHTGQVITTVRVLRGEARPGGAER
ncbi:MAG TPA: DinB family protein [Longimicrobiales bacterium]